MSTCLGVVTPELGLRPCPLCGRSIPVHETRYYLREGGKLSKGSVLCWRPHLAPCGRDCAQSMPLRQVPLSQLHGTECPGCSELEARA